ncbi:MAG: hypothetical protein QXS92_04650 [Thermofilum sp.]
MGKLIEAIRELEPKYDRAVKLARDLSTYVLHNRMIDFVYEAFESLKPLSNRFRKVAELSEGELYIGEWLRVKKWYRVRRGVEVRNKEEFFELIRSYGDLMKPLVRRMIREDFSRLVDLTKALSPYNSIRLEVKVPNIEVHTCFCASWIDSMVIDSFRVAALAFDSRDPLSIELVDQYGQCKLFNVASLSFLPAFEDLADYVFELYQMAEEAISMTREHNEKVMKEMREVIAPYVIARELTS